MDYVRDRIQHRIADSDLGSIDAILADVGIAVADGDLTAIPEVALGLRDALTSISSATP